MAKLAKDKLATELYGSYTCGLCENYSFDEKSKLFKHAKICSTEKAAIANCQFCPNLAFKGMTDLSRHLLKYHQIPIKTPISCTFCGLEVQNWTDLIRHQQVCWPMLDHKSFQKCFYCDVCWFFPKYYNMFFIAHINNHHRDAHEIRFVWPFQCKFCEFYFPNDKIRLEHEKVCIGKYKQDEVEIVILEDENENIEKSEENETEKIEMAVIEHIDCSEEIITGDI